MFVSAGLLVMSPGVFQDAASATTTVPPFTECPAVGYGLTCALVVNVTNTGTQILSDPTGGTKPNDPVLGAYDGVEDTLIGLVNDSTAPVSMVNLSSTLTAFAFDDDGVCQDPNSTSHLAGPVPPCGSTIVMGTNYDNGRYPDKDNTIDKTGYGGPDGYFTNISPNLKTGTINFITAIPPGGTTYFSLEEKLTASVFCQDSITLSPLTSSYTIGGTATVTATILNNFTPAPGVPVTFKISAGPNAGKTTTVTTDTNGLATFVYSSLATGTDTVQATYTDPDCGSHSASPATIAWVKAGPSMTTQTSPTSLTVGTPTTVGDTATFQDTKPGIPPTGSVTFTMYSDDTCLSPAGISGTGPVTTTNAGVSSAKYTTTWTAPAAGTYYWTASYPGDGNYDAFQTYCSEANESIKVAPASPSIMTQASPGSVTVGTATTVGDTATFQNTTAVPPTGSVRFTLYTDNTCTTPAGVSGSGTITTDMSGVSSASFLTTWTAPTATTYYWVATYPGDQNNQDFTTDCPGANEIIVVKPASPSITTQAGPASITVGTPTNVGDTATFQNTTSVPPTGSVTFTLYSDATCTVPVPGVSGTGTITTTPSGVSSASYSTTWTAPAAGTYSWIASYPGDQNNNSFTTGCTDAYESVKVIPASLSMTTQAGPTSITVGTPTNVGDTATFRNTTAVPPTGSVTFTLYADSTCATPVGPSVSAPITTTNGVSSASVLTPWTAPTTGTYYWSAKYVGDQNNDAFTTGCPGLNESITVNPASPSITTQAAPTALTVGTTITVGDTATFQNATSVPPTGTVTFALYSDSACSVPVTGVSGTEPITTTNGTSSASFSTTWNVPTAGTYYWVAVYPGDQNNNTFKTACNEPTESIVLNPPSGGGGGGPTQDPTATTTLLQGAGHAGTAISVPSGTPVTDLATLSGLNASGAAGTMTYAVYADPNCQIPVATGGYEPIFRGSIPSSGPVTLTTPGTYYWRASYSGDVLNLPSTSACGAETEIVNARGGSGNTVDHFLCYTAASTPTSTSGFNVPPAVGLFDQFSPNGFGPTIGGVDLDCNPAQKTVRTGVTPITNPEAHLLCWNITAPTGSRTVSVTNQFGTATLNTGTPTQLCLPSWSSAQSPPAKTPATPPGLSHFTCYTVSYAPGTTPFKPPKSVLVKDQFATKPVKVNVGTPKLLCLPTTKIVNGVTYPAQNPQTHLLCFTVSPTPTRNPVYDENQFGTGKVQIKKTALLCLPSTKVIVGPAP